MADIIVAIALFFIFSVPVSWGAKTGCHPATVFDWDAALAASKKENSYPHVSLDWEQYKEAPKYQSGRPMTNAEKPSGRGSFRRTVDDNSKFSKYWTQTDGMCVDIEGNKAPYYHKELGTKNYKVDCQKSCENSYGCEAYSIHLEKESGQLWATSCSLYGERVVPPHGFECVAGGGKSESVRGEFPSIRCFVRVPEGPSKLSIVADAGRPAGLKVNVQLKKNREATASYLQLQGSVLTIQDSILEITGARPLCAPADGECDIANVDTRSQIKVLSSSTYVSPSDTVVQPRVVQVTCPGITNRKTEVSCHADGTWHAASTCSKTTTASPQISNTATFTNIGSAVGDASTVAAVSTVTAPAHEQNDDTLIRDNLLIIAVSVVIFIAILFIATVCIVVSALCRRKHAPVAPLQNVAHTSVELVELSHTGVETTETYDKVEYF